jgi:large subunit ribosomal protein L30
MYAVIRLRGSINIEDKIEDTLNMLNLTRKNHCVLVPKNKNYEGMLERVKNYVTYGEINKETLEELVKKRARKQGDKKLTEKEAKEIIEKIWKNKSVKNTGIKRVFRLSPPSKGLKSIKKQYPKGDLGYRGEEINKLLKRMI